MALMNTNCVGKCSLHFTSVLQELFLFLLYFIPPEVIMYLLSVGTCIVRVVPVQAHSEIQSLAEKNLQPIDEW